VAATPTSPFLRTSEHERAKEKDKKKKKISAPKEKDPSSYRSELFRAGWRPTREVVVVADKREVEKRDTRWCPSQSGPRSGRGGAEARGGGRDEKC